MTRKTLPLKILVLVLAVMLSFSVATAATKTKAYAPHVGTCPDSCICASAAEYAQFSPNHKGTPEYLCGGSGSKNIGCGEADPRDNPRICWTPFPFCGDGECAGNETATSCSTDCKPAPTTTNQTNATAPAKPTGPPGAPQCGDCTPSTFGNCTSPSIFSTEGTQSGTCKDLCDNTLTKTQSCVAPSTFSNMQVGGVNTPIFIGIVIAILVIAGVAASMRKKPKEKTDRAVPQFKKLKKQ